MKKKGDLSSMAKLSEINWDLVKFEYEILGATLQDLQEKYEISSTLMEYNARNWVQAPASKRDPLSFTKLENITELSAEIASQVKQESEITSLIKQKFLLPKYIELENILLSKATALATSLETDRTGSANAIKTLASVLKDLLSHNPLLGSGGEEETQTSVDHEWKVTFVNAGIESTDKASTVSDDEETI